MNYRQLVKRIMVLISVLICSSIIMETAWAGRSSKFKGRSFKGAASTSISGRISRRSKVNVSNNRNNISNRVNNANVNRFSNNNINVNRRNTVVNVNRNVNIRVSRYYDNGYDNDVGNFVAGAVVGGIIGSAVTRAAQPTVVIGSSITTLPSGCTTIITNDVTYHRCGTAYYRPYYDGSNLVYTLEPSPY